MNKRLSWKVAIETTDCDFSAVKFDLWAESTLVSKWLVSMVDFRFRFFSFLLLSFCQFACLASKKSDKVVRKDFKFRFYFKPYNLLPDNKKRSNTWCSLCSNIDFESCHCASSSDLQAFLFRSSRTWIISKTNAPKVLQIEIRFLICLLAGLVATCFDVWFWPVKRPNERVFCEFPHISPFSALDVLIAPERTSFFF